MRGTWIAFALSFSLSTTAAYAQEGEPPPPTAKEHGRGRYGVDGFGGAAVGNRLDGTGTIFGLAVRTGYQFKPAFALYAQTELYGLDAEGHSGDTTFKAGFGARFVALASYSPVSWLELGGGPAFDALLFASSSAPLVYSEDARPSPPGPGGFYFGFVEHVVVRLTATHDADRRTGPALVADVHSMIAQDRFLTTFTGGLGYEWF